MMLTNYPFNRELVAERQRDLLAETERRRRTRLGQPRRPDPVLDPDGTWVSWLLRPSRRRRRNTGPATA